jgi:hypothetical protein
MDARRIQIHGTGASSLGTHVRVNGRLTQLGIHLEEEHSYARIAMPGLGSLLRPQAQPQTQNPQPSQVQQDPQQQLQAQGVAPPGMGAPGSDEEYQSRKQGWTQIFSDLKEDPETLATLMVIGNQLMQPAANEGQRFANASFQGMSYQMALQRAQVEIDEQRRAAGLEEREMRVAEGGLDVQQRNVAVQEGTLKESTRQFDQEYQEKIARLGLDAAELVSLDRFRQAQGKAWIAQTARWKAQTASDHGEMIAKLAEDIYSADWKAHTDSFGKVAAPSWESALAKAMETGVAMWDKNAPGYEYHQKQKAEGKPVPTWADIEHTAEKHGMSVDEVLKKLGLTRELIKNPGTRG